MVQVMDWRGRFITRHQRWRGTMESLHMGEEMVSLSPL